MTGSLGSTDTGDHLLRADCLAGSPAGHGPGMPADAIVIGSGPNGLVAANLLADQGWTVTVVEAAASPGGAVRSAELIEPGYVNDLFSAFYPLAAASSVLSGFELERYGLRWCHSPAVVAHPTADGSCPVLSRDLDATAGSLDSFHPGDGDAWRRFFERWTSVQEPFLGALMSPFPPARHGLQLARSIPPREWARFARFMLLPVRRMAEEEFGSDQAARLLAGLALHADLSPEMTLSGMYGWLLASLGQSVGFPVPEGGAGRLIAALVSRLVDRGGSLVCNAPVAEVIVRQSRACAVRLEDGTEIDAGRAILADVGAPQLYGRMVAPEHLPPSVLDDLARFHWDNATVKIDWTLNGPIPWEAPEARTAGTVHVAEGIDALTTFAAELARSVVPTRPFLLVGQQSMTDPSRQPAGKETAWAYTHVPRKIRGDGRGVITGAWDAADVEAMVSRMEAEVEALAPGFAGLIRGRHVFTPPGMEAANANLVVGAINGGTAQLHQQLVFRPVPGNGRPETPVSGLYLASASAHPGGGVHGAAGSNAARAALAHDRAARTRRAIASAPSRLRRRFGKSGGYERAETVPLSAAEERSVVSDSSARFDGSLR